MTRRTILLSSSTLAVACSSAAGDSSQKGGSLTDAQHRDSVVVGMHDAVAAELVTLVQAARDLQNAAPVPEDRGWSAEMDADALTTMRDAWRQSRVAYEHIEGATAPIFPDIDAAIDGRYDTFLTELGGTGDADPFDGVGVTGMHAIERVLFAPTVRPEVITFEHTLPGYQPPRWPSTATEAQTFKAGLAQKLIEDVGHLQAQWLPASIDLGVAFHGLIALMNEQSEKVNKTATGAEESRYANITLFDLRNNLDGTSAIYDLFRDWVQARAPLDSTEAGSAADVRVVRGLADLRSLYAEFEGDAIPQPPATWSSLAPTADDLATPFGRLFAGVERAVDPADSTSVVSNMNEIATALGFPLFRVGQ